VEVFLSYPKQIPVTGVDGFIGYVDPATPYPTQEIRKAAEGQRVLIQLKAGKQVWIAADMLEEQEGGGYYLPLTQEQAANSAAVRNDDRDLVIPVIEEQVRISRQELPRGVVRITKQVHERIEEIDEPHFRENVHVERVPLNQVLEELAEPRVEGDTLIIPVMEEVLVVEKRILLKEEIHVTKLREEIHEPRQVTLR
jgi:uncharacterized protein (TIGR02271 family)